MLEAWSFNHCTTREVLINILIPFKKFYCIYIFLVYSRTYHTNLIRTCFLKFKISFKIDINLTSVTSKSNFIPLHSPASLYFIVVTNYVFIFCIPINTDIYLLVPLSLNTVEYKKWSYKANCPDCIWMTMLIAAAFVHEMLLLLYFKDGHKEHKLILHGKVKIKCFEIRQSRGCV